MATTGLMVSLSEFIFVGTGDDVVSSLKKRLCVAMETRVSAHRVLDEALTLNLAAGDLGGPLYRMRADARTAVVGFALDIAALAVAGLKSAAAKPTLTRLIATSWAYLAGTASADAVTHAAQSVITDSDGAVAAVQAALAATHTPPNPEVGRFTVFHVGFAAYAIERAALAARRAGIGDAEQLRALRQRVIAFDTPPKQGVHVPAALPVRSRAAAETPWRGERARRWSVATPLPS